MRNTWRWMERRQGWTEFKALHTLPGVDGGCFVSDSPALLAGAGVLPKPADCASAKLTEASSPTENCRDFNPSCPSCKTALCSVLSTQVEGRDSTQRAQGQIQELQSAPVPHMKNISQPYRTVSYFFLCIYHSHIQMMSKGS